MESYKSLLFIRYKYIMPCRYKSIMQMRRSRPARQTDSGSVQARSRIGGTSRPGWQRKHEHGRQWVEALTPTAFGLTGFRRLTAQILMTRRARLFIRRSAARRLARLDSMLPLPFEYNAYGWSGKIWRVRSSGGFWRNTLTTPPANATTASPHTIASTASTGFRNATAT